MPGLRDILAGGASGAGAGAAIGSLFPGAGTLIGAGIGGVGGVLSGIFGGGDERRAEGRLNQSLSQTTGIRDRLLNRYSALGNADPRQTATFQSGRGALRDLLSDRSQADASSAAARGLSGGEFEIAQAANRQRSSTDFLRNLLGQSEQMQQRDQEGVLAQLMNAQGMANQITAGQLSREDRQRQNNQAAISSAIMNALLASRGGK